MRQVGSMYGNGVQLLEEMARASGFPLGDRPLGYRDNCRPMTLLVGRRFRNANQSVSVVGKRIRIATAVGC